MDNSEILFRRKLLIGFILFISILKVQKFEADLPHHRHFVPNKKVFCAKEKKKKRKKEKEKDLTKIFLQTIFFPPKKENQRTNGIN